MKKNFKISQEKITHEYRYDRIRKNKRRDL